MLTISYGIGHPTGVFRNKRLANYIILAGRFGCLECKSVGMSIKSEFPLWPGPSLLSPAMFATYRGNEKQPATMRLYDKRGR